MFNISFMLYGRDLIIFVCIREHIYKRVESRVFVTQGQKNPKLAPPLKSLHSSHRPATSLTWGKVKQTRFDLLENFCSKV